MKSVRRITLYDANGVELSVQDGVPVPASTPRVLIAGLEGGTVRTIALDAGGNLGVQDSPNFDVALSTRSSETTLDALKTSFEATDFATQTTLAAVLAAFNAEDFSSETTLAALLSAFNAEDFSSETTLSTLLSAFNAEDFASETTLTAFKANFDATDFATQTTLAALLAAFVAEDFASETTLAAFKAAFDIRDLATETTLAAFKAAFDVRDLATETTLAAFKANFDARDLATETTLAAFKANFDARDLATETTLAALRTDFNAEDFASETTLAAFKANFDVRDLATETTLDLIKVAAQSIDTDFDVALSTRLSEAEFTTRINTQGQKLMAASTPVVIASDQSPITVTQENRDDVVFVHYNLLSVGAVGYGLVIDLDNAGGAYKHGAGTQVKIASLHTDLEKTTIGATYNSQCGVVLSVAGGNTVVSWFTQFLLKVRDENIHAESSVLFPMFLNAEVSGGATTSIASNNTETLTGITAANDVGGVSRTFAPGDIIMRVLRISGGGSAEGKLGIGYLVQ